MLARDFDLPAEAKVIADEDSRACHETCRIRHVVAVADAHHPAEVGLGTAGECDGQDSEVSRAGVAERVGFFEDGEPAGFQLADHLAEDHLVAQRIP